jgi:uncharacterized protein
MKIQLDKIPELGLELNFSGNEDILSDALGKVSFSDEIKIDPKIKGSLTLNITGHEMLVRGNIQVTVTQLCSRCLRDYDSVRDLEFDLLLKSKDPESPLDQEYEQGEGSTFFVEGDEFDPGDMITQEIFLELPIKPLCSDECPGLCPQCGALKGSPECLCPPGQRRDIRWNALAGLKDRMPEPNS